MTDQQEAPEGLLLAIANAHDDAFRWKVAAAVVEVATGKLTLDPDDAFARRAIYEWTAIGEVFARYLAVGTKMPAGTADETIIEAVTNCWDMLKE